MNFKRPLYHNEQKNIGVIFNCYWLIQKCRFNFGIISYIMFYIYTKFSNTHFFNFNICTIGLYILDLIKTKT